MRKGYSILVIRVSDGKLKMSRPCERCIQMMKKVGIRKVYYSDDGGKIVMERVKHMKSDHQSKYYKKCVNTISIT